MAKDLKNKEKKVKTEKAKSHFFKDTKAELKKVIWPTPKELLNNTLSVIVIVLITGAIVFVLDLCFKEMNDYGVEKLKAIAGSNNTTSETNTTDDVSTNSEETNIESVDEQNTQNSEENSQNSVVTNAE